MKAVIIAVGDEVLTGDVVNSNAAFLASALTGAGYEILWHKTVADSDGPVRDAFLEAWAAADLVITTGGMGPTRDDMTKKAVADALGLEMEENPQAAAWFEERFHAAPGGLAQSLMPAGAIPLYNANGTAPGVLASMGGRTLVMLPGPPRELNPMFLDHAMPLLGKPDKRFAVRYYMTAGMGEAALEKSLREAGIEDGGYTVNTYLTSSGVMFKATAFAGSEREAMESIESHDGALREVLGEWLYATDKIELWQLTCRILIEKGITVSSAESFTGGLFAEHLTRVAGISKCFAGSCVCYSASAKAGLLADEAGVLESFGTVSSQTAAALAQAAAARFGTDAAVATTGVAGDEPVEGKEPGTCFIGVFFRGKTIVHENIVRGDRQTVKERAVRDAFRLLYGLVKG